jgi:hypothetical protein
LDAGYTANTPKYGAGDWQYTATDYNDQGNVVRELDERALRAVIDNNAPADQLATITVYNSDISTAGVVVTPAGTLVTDTYGPARWAALKDGTLAWVCRETVRIRALRRLRFLDTSRSRSAGQHSLECPAWQSVVVADLAYSVAPSAGRSDKRQIGRAAEQISRAPVAFRRGSCA